MSTQANRVLSVLSIVMGLSISASSEAELYDRGNGLIYDDVLNVTWMQDANLFKTMIGTLGDAQSIQNFVTQIRSANNGIVYDTPNYYDTPIYSGTKSLTNLSYITPYPGNPDIINYDFYSDGRMSWWGGLKHFLDI